MSSSKQIQLGSTMKHHQCLTRAVSMMWSSRLRRAWVCVSSTLLLSQIPLKYFIFFSSRRRHTRCLSDWSSDVCSSDLRQFIHVGESFHIHLFGASCILEGEILGPNLGAAFPIPDRDAVFRCLRNLVAGDDIAAGIGTASLRNPDLPVDFFRSKGEVIAFDAANHTAAKVLYVDHSGHELIVDIRQQ